MTAAQLHGRGQHDDGSSATWPVSPHTRQLGYMAGDHSHPRRTPNERERRSCALPSVLPRSLARTLRNVANVRERAVQVTSPANASLSGGRSSERYDSFDSADFGLRERERRDFRNAAASNGLPAVRALCHAVTVATCSSVSTHETFFVERGNVERRNERTRLPYFSRLDSPTSEAARSFGVIVRLDMYPPFVRSAGLASDATRTFVLSRFAIVAFARSFRVAFECKAIEGERCVRSVTRGVYHMGHTERTRTHANERSVTRTQQSIVCVSSAYYASRTPPVYPPVGTAVNKRHGPA